MIPDSTLRAAIDKLPKYKNSANTYVSWIGLGQSCLIKISWFSRESALCCYIDFKNNQNERDAVLKAAFLKFAKGSSEAFHDTKVGVTYSFSSNEVLTPNDIIELAKTKDIGFTLIYAQEDISARPLFEDLGIPLIPGETGKEWVKGDYLSYSGFRG